MVKRFLVFSVIYGGLVCAGSSYGATKFPSITFENVGNFAYISRAKYTPVNWSENEKSCLEKCYKLIDEQFQQELGLEEMAEKKNEAEMYIYQIIDFMQPLNYEKASTREKLKLSNLSLVARNLKVLFFH